MNEIIVAVGSKNNLAADILALGKTHGHEGKIIVTAGKDIKKVVLEKASALFLEEGLLLILVDPERKTLEELKARLDLLRQRVRLILYTTTAPPPDYLKNVADTISYLDQDRESRMKKLVLAFVKRYNKKMTDKAFRVLLDRVRDESTLESELMKLVNYIGDKPSIDSKDIHAIVTEMHEENLITLFEAVANIDKEKVLTIFENLVRNGLHILAIHSYLVRQTRLLLQAKDMEELYRANPDYGTFVKTFGKWKENLEIKSSEKKHYYPFQKPFYAHKLSQASRRISRQTLVSFLNSLTMSDVRMKRGTRFDQTFMERDLLDL